MQIVGIPGSLRAGSFNLALLRAAAELAPDGVTVDVASIRGIPLYDGDLERKDGIPAEVAALKDRVAAADGLLIVSPEYNGSVTGVLKNDVDWMTRPASDSSRVFGDLPVALTGATPGGTGTRLAQTAWLSVLRNLGTRPWFGKNLFVGGASKLFDEQMRLTDEPMRERVAAWVEGFARFAEQNARSR